MQPDLNQNPTNPQPIDPNTGQPIQPPMPQVAFDQPQVPPIPQADNPILDPNPGFGNNNATMPGAAPVPQPGMPMSMGGVPNPAPMAGAAVTPTGAGGIVGKIKQFWPVIAGALVLLIVALVLFIFVL